MLTIEYPCLSDLLKRALGTVMPLGGSARGESPRSMVWSLATVAKLD